MSGAFDARIQVVRARVDELGDQLAAGGGDAGELAAAALAELASSLEELSVAGEELSTQTESLQDERSRLEGERQYFRDLFELTPAASLVTDGSATVVAANRPASALFGVTVPFLLGKPISVFLEPSDQSAMFRLVARARQSPHQTLRGDLTLRRRSGQTVLVTVAVAMVPIADDVQLRWVLAESVAERGFDDLTPSELELRSAPMRLDAIVDSASDGIVSIDQDQRIVLFNRAAQELFGRDAAEVVGAPASILFPEHLTGSHHTLITAFAASADSTRPMTGREPVEVTRKDGRSFPADITISNVHYDDHWVATAIVRDVTDRERSIRDLRFAEEFNRRVIETIDALVVVTDPSGEILVFNAACERSTGYASHEVEGRSMVEVLVAEEDRPRANEVLADLEGGGQRRFEVDWVARDGGRRRIAWSTGVLRDERGVVTHIIGAGLDITHERALEQQLEVARRLETLGQLAGGIAHDFNNLVAVVQGHLELLGETDGLPPKARDRVVSIQSALTRGSALIANLTALGRPGGAPAVTPVHDVITSLAVLIEDVLGLDVVLELHLDAPEDRVPIERSRIEQVVFNLVLNARDALGGPGRVLVSTAEGADRDEVGCLLLTVADTGRGMTPEVLARAFDPFFTTKGSGAGTGLGLATVKSIVEASGGSIEVDSTPDTGTTVALRLPVFAVGAGALAPGSGASPSADGEPATVLVVDDEPQIRTLARDILEAAGYRVCTAAGADEATARFEDPADEIDLLLTDIVMPLVHGDELATGLVARRPDLAVVFMTGYGEPAFEHPTGHARVLSKPFSRDALVAAVREALAGRPGAPAPR